MRVPLNDLGRAYERDRPALDAAVADVLTSGWYVHGRQHAAFEEELAAFVGVDHCVGVASGTDALELALRAVALEGRTHVVTAANAGGYTSVAALRAGLVPRYADVDVATHCLRAADVKAVLDDDVAAVVVTHLYGRLADVGPLVELAATAGIPVVEDCAQAIGASRAGVAAGAFATVGTFSFYPTKNLGALGDGGALATHDGEVAERLRLLRQYGWEAKYRIGLPGGRNSRLDELQAAILRVRLPGVLAANERRRAIIARYRSAASGSIAVLPAEGADHSGHLAVAVAGDRDGARAALDSAGVATDVHYPVPDHRQPGLPGGDVSLPVTERLAGQVLTLPCFPELTDQEVDAVCEALAAL